MHPNKLTDGYYGMTQEKQEAMDNRFTYHTPLPTQPERYEEVRASAKRLVEDIFKCVPDSREQSIAIMKIEEAMFWANAGIARNENAGDIG